MKNCCLIIITINILNFATFLSIYNNLSENMGQALSSLLFQPPPISYSFSSPKKNFLFLRTISNISISAFYIDRKSSLTMLFSHGNAEDIGMIYEPFVRLSRELNVNVLAYDYEGS